MAELHLKGYLCDNFDGIVALKNAMSDRYGDSIISSIESFADKHGMSGEHHKGLGGRHAFIDDCSLKAYFTSEECEMEEAMLSMDVIMYGGDIKTRVDWCGYSEWTITGLDLEEFTIGGHNLESELRSHYGEYCHLIIEC